MSKVAYTQMADMTQADADLFVAYGEQYTSALGDRILAAVTELEQFQGPVQVSRREHLLQTATRAHNDGMDEEYVVAALVHDIGDTLAPYSHGEYAAIILRPFVSERICWIIEHHPVFQDYYYVHFHGGDRYARNRFKDHPYFNDCLIFCDRYDQKSFDPDYESLPLTFFEPLVRRVFSEPRYLPKALLLIPGIDPIYFRAPWEARLA